MKKVFFSVLLVLLLLASSPASALKISPFKTTLTPGDSFSSRVFRVENNSPESAAVQVSVWTWDVALDGSETNTSAEDAFVVFPAQFILAPHESRAVRVQWTGKQPPAAETPFRLLAEQLPVALKDTAPAESAVRFLLRFKAALYVSPPVVKSDVRVADITMPAGDMLRVTLENRGTGHTLLQKPALRLTLTDGAVTTLSGPSLKTLEGENIHAGKKRYFDVPLPPATGRVASAEIDFETAF